jgi:nitrite reductase/ring-hydroxylating ferredoxin subunit
MTYALAAKTTDMAPGQMTAVNLNGTQVLLVNMAGEFHAIQAKCPHMGAELCKGQLQGSIVTCPKHKAGFDVRDGSAVDPAKVLFLKMKTKDAKSYTVKIEEDQLLVDI